MSVTLFGSCRINGIKNNNNLNNIINYTHTTKEVLQQIKFLMGKMQFPPPFDVLCFRTSIVEKKPMIYDDSMGKLFNESMVCVIEICSEKKYMYHDFYLHHLSVDKRFSYHNCDIPQSIVDNIKCIKQTYSEIEEDIIEIKKLLESKKMIVVTHYNSKLNGQYLESRNALIHMVVEICEKHGIPVIQPAEVLHTYSQEEVMTSDLGHYTDVGLAAFSDYINRYLEY